MNRHKKINIIKLFNTIDLLIDKANDDYQKIDIKFSDLINQKYINQSSSKEIIKLVEDYKASIISSSKEKEIIINKIIEQLNIN